MDPQKRRGRPSLAPGEQSAAVNVKLPSSLYDTTYAAAQRARVSMPELVRRALQHELVNPFQASPSTSISDRALTAIPSPPA